MSFTISSNGDILQNHCLEVPARVCGTCFQDPRGPLPPPVLPRGHTQAQGLAEGLPFQGRPGFNKQAGVPHRMDLLWKGKAVAPPPPHCSSKLQGGPAHPFYSGLKAFMKIHHQKRRAVTFTVNGFEPNL